ncbi:MAG: ABC transporter ATP-binding protein [Planctomycetes bacterium]|nr:ABC transporter ATP-binding protein [Planctomycetota bacterium]
MPEASVPAVVEALGVTRRFGEHLALRGVSLEVRRGEIFGLLGTNGAGKTTLLRILATILEPTAGSVLVNGMALWRQRDEVRRQIGYLPDPFVPYDELRAIEYLEYFARIFRVRPWEPLSGELLKLVGLEGMGRRLVGAFSKGMKQRLGVARCLLHDPRLLLLDEPASGLDPRGRVELLELCRELRAMGKTVIVTSHILPELEAVCDRFAILDGGRMMRQGTLEQLRTAPPDGARVLLRVEGGELELEALLRGRPGVAVVSGGGGEWVLHLRGGAEARSRLLADVTRAGVRVREFREQPLGLDDVFLDATGTGGN